MPKLGNVSEIGRSAIWVNSWYVVRKTPIWMILEAGSNSFTCRGELPSELELGLFFASGAGVLPL